VTRRRQAEDERRVLVDLTPKGVSLRKRTEQMLGEFYCFLNMPLDELFDLKDRLRHFVSSAGPKEANAAHAGASILARLCLRAGVVPLG
jgi:DNA-binding MarR family transcriptional regulator